MAGHAGEQDPGKGTNAQHETNAPRWVKVFGIVALVLVVLFVILHLTVGGPGSHTAL